MHPTTIAQFACLYEKSYTKRLGEKPAEQEVVEAARLVKPGSGLDIGCGMGGNTLFLARAGFKMKAIDLSKHAIKHIKSCSDKEGLGVQADVGSVTQELLPNNFNIIVNCYLLDHFTQEEAYLILLRMIEKTSKGGINVVVTFSKPAGDPIIDLVFPSNPDRYAFDLGELLLLYSGWKIISCDLTRHNSVGLVGHLPTARLIAQKI